MTNIPGSLVVAFKKGTTEAKAKEIVESVPDCKLVSFMSSLLIGQVKCPIGKEDEVVAILNEKKG